MNVKDKPLTQKGEKYKSFIIDEAIYIEELNCLLRKIVHEPSNAHIIQLENDDDENVFCLAFRTLPDTSNGVAHILEHTVLCGSKKFPVKDPFFSMNRRSLNTYMNALTGPDFTCYPAATQVPKDFYNLLEVYLDAVFHPELKELSFLQEGHRLEFQDPQDSSSPLTFKGIVFNEMKGAFSSPMSRLWDRLMQKLFPDILYSKNFGGKPLEIPKLTYQGLKDFHKTFYQESRCTFCFYGNLPIEKHLDFLEENTLKDAQKHSSLKPNPIQPKLEKPVQDSFGYPIASHEETKDKTYHALAWLTCPLKDQLDILGLQVLDLILMGTDAAPLKIEILKSNLCHNVHSVLEDELSQVPYGLIFEGSEKNHLKPLKEIVFKTLEKMANNPIDEELIDGAIHQLELHRTEINSDYGPFGLSLLLKIVPLHHVGASFENNLKIHCQFEELRKRVQEPTYFKNLIEKYFLNNSHFVEMTMYPDSEVIKKEVEEEEAQLDELRETINDAKALEIIQKTEELKEFQEDNENQDLEVLPKVTLQDVSLEPRKLKLLKKKVGSANSYFHPCHTNGIVYQNICLKLPYISFDDLSYIRLFAYLIPQLGSAKRNYQENLKMIQAHTGGISAFLDSFIPVENHETFVPYLIFQGKCLTHHFESMTTLMLDMVNEPQLEDQNRLKELLAQLFVELDHDLKQNSLRYAVNLSSSGFYLHGYVNHYWAGLGYYHLIKKIASNLDEEIPLLIHKLKELKEILIHGQDYDIITTCSENLYPKIEKIVERYGHIEKKDYKPWNPDFSPKPISSQGKISSSSVFFTSMALKTVGMKEKTSQHLSIASKLLDNTYLHRVIREQGGAYGGGSSNKMNSGKFCFYAYRDPNLANTIQAYHKASEKIASGDFSDQELEEAKLGVIQKLDHPISPEYQGLTAYSWEKEHKTYEFRKELRQNILSASREDIQKAVKEEILSKLKEAITVTFGPKEKLEKENKNLKPHLEITSI